MLQIKKRLRDWLGVPPPVHNFAHNLYTKLDSGSLRARPGQVVDAQYAYSTGPNYESTLATFGYNAWVQTAASRLASRAAAAEVTVVSRSDQMQRHEDHPLLALVGEYGRPNDYQDALEFWEQHFLTLDLAGNSYWFWFSPFGGAPTEVHQLEPSLMTVVPGARYGVARYVYRLGGREFDLEPRQVTHFKRSCPGWTNYMSRYYGMSAIEALRLEIHSDHAMLNWNKEFFDDDVAVPAGILVIPSDVADGELKRVEDELSGKYGQRRRTAVVRSAVGGTVYHPAGIAPRDMDFTEGRMLSRKAIYEALELPLGLMSEASTEAHARVAERQLAETIRIRQVRTRFKLNSDALDFWPAAKLRRVEFEDLSLRSADWDRELKHFQAIKPYMPRNEVRERLLHLPALTEEQKKELDHELGTKDNQSAPGGGNTDPVQQRGQAGNMVDGKKQSPSEPVQ